MADRRVRAGFRAALDRSLPGAWSQAVRDAGTSFGVELTSLQEWPRDATDLESIQVPTLSVVHPDEIWSGFAQIHEATVSHSPHCQAATVAIKSHLLQIGDPVLVAQAISSFLGNRQFGAAPEM